MYRNGQRAFCGSACGGFTAAMTAEEGPRNLTQNTTATEYHFLFLYNALYDDALADPTIGHSYDRHTTRIGPKRAMQLMMAVRYIHETTLYLDISLMTVDSSHGLERTLPSTE